MREFLQTDQTLPETSAIVSKSKSDTSRKRKRSFADTLTAAYASVSFTPRKFSGKCNPDSPHFFFSSSYSVVQSELQSDKEGDDIGDLKRDVDVHQVIHQHVNGLCMVTAGELSIPPSKIIRRIRYVANEAPSCSNAQNRKLQAKMMKGRGKTMNVVSPSTVIAELVLEERISEDKEIDSKDIKETVIPLRACVWGKILELNSANLSPELLLQDPLLDGFIAIILPTGNFPPASAIAKVIDTDAPNKSASP